jgi:hypothetical protein
MRARDSICRLGISFGGVILACAGSVVQPSPPPAAAPVAGPCAARAASAAPELRVRLRPVPNADGGVVDVALDVSGAAAGLRNWRAPLLQGALELRVTAASGCGGASAEQRLQAASGELVTLAVPEGASALHIEYRVPPQPLAPPYWRLEPNWFLAQGRRVLLLPAERDWAAEAQVEIDASAYGEMARGVSSLGIVAAAPAPQRSVRMTLPALELALFAAGWLGSALFDAPEGHDEAAWFGSSMFDMRLVAAEVASFRTAVREVFHDAEQRPLTLIAMADRDQGFEARRAPVSVLLRVAADERLTAPLRLELLQQVMKEWIGGQLALREASGAEPAWFVEGLSRYLARELALEFGLISSQEFAADVNGLMAIQAVLARRECALDGATAEAPDSSAPSCLRVLEAVRGALHATELDLALRARKSSLVELLSSLLASRVGALTPAAWNEALEKLGGAPALRVHEAFLASARQPLLLPGNAFGPCFERGATRYAESLLGFAVERTSDAAAPLRVRSVSPGGPAATAGLRPEALLQRIEHVPYDVQRPIRLLLAGGGSLEYRGAEVWVSGLGWRRVPGVKEERCRMSGRAR